MASAITTYIKAIESDLASGRANELTYRPVLKTLLESLGVGTAVMNEPKYAAWGVKKRPLGF